MAKMRIASIAEIEASATRHARVYGYRGALGQCQLRERLLDGVGGGWWQVKSRMSGSRGLDQVTGFLCLRVLTGWQHTREQVAESP